MPIAAESGVTAQDIVSFYRPDFTKQMMSGINLALLETTDIIKKFLVEHGCLTNDFDLSKWINPEPLQEAMRREAS